MCRLLFMLSKTKRFPALLLLSHLKLNDWQLSFPFALTDKNRSPLFTLQMNRSKIVLIYICRRLNWILKNLNMLPVCQQHILDVVFIYNFIGAGYNEKSWFCLYPSKKIKSTVFPGKVLQQSFERWYLIFQFIMAMATVGSPFGKSPFFNKKQNLSYSCQTLWLFLIPSREHFGVSIVSSRDLTFLWQPWYVFKGNWFYG